MPSKSQAHSYKLDNDFSTQSQKPFLKKQTQQSKPFSQDQKPQNKTLKQNTLLNKRNKIAENINFQQEDINPELTNKMRAFSADIVKWRHDRKVQWILKISKNVSNNFLHIIFYDFLFLFFFIL